MTMHTTYFDLAETPKIIYSFIFINFIQAINQPIWHPKRTLKWQWDYKQNKLSLHHTYLYNFSICQNRELISCNILKSYLASEKWILIISTYIQSILWNVGLFHKGGRSKVEWQIITKQVIIYSLTYYSI